MTHLTRTSYEKIDGLCCRTCHQMISGYLTGKGRIVLVWGKCGCHGVVATIFKDILTSQLEASMLVYRAPIRPI